MEYLTDYWEQFVVLGLGVFAIIKIKFSVDSLTKDVADLIARNTYIDVVQLKSEMSQVQRNVTTLWDHVNKLKDDK
jgi:cell division protein FtsB